MLVGVLLVRENADEDDVGFVQGIQAEAVVLQRELQRADAVLVSLVDVVKAAIAGVGADAGFARQELYKGAGEVTYGKSQFPAAQVNRFLEIREMTA